MCSKLRLRRTPRAQNVESRGADRHSCVASDGFASSRRAAGADGCPFERACMKMAASRESAARRYRIEKYLTEGGMGDIYLGKKMGSGGFQKEVVLKQLLPEYTARPEFRDLFFREAKISATLDHANIVHTFDLVESDQSLFIVMEYVRGADLRTIL